MRMRSMQRAMRPTCVVEIPDGALQKIHDMDQLKYRPTEAGFVPSYGSRT
jgi:hypothetical protein